MHSKEQNPTPTFFSKKDSNAVTGYKYQRAVYEGRTGWIHNIGENITEIFVPSSKLIFNSKGYIFNRDKTLNPALQALGALGGVLFAGAIVEPAARPLSQGVRLGVHTGIDWLKQEDKDSKVIIPLRIGFNIDSKEFKSQRLYRGDSRVYSEIFTVGFKSYGTDTNLIHHYSAGEGSAYVSTSVYKEIAMKFPFSPATERL